MLDETDGAGAPQALSWSWELDFAALLDSLNEPGPHDPTGPGAAPSLWFGWCVWPGCAARCRPEPWGRRAGRRAG